MTTALITGLQGEGKTHFAVKKFILENVGKRPIYSNIDGLCVEGVEPIPVNDKGELDWQLCPKADADEGKLGSLIVYDEAQKLKDNLGVKYFAAKNREPISPREVIAELDEHRHDGYDIVFITQSAMLLHTHLLQLCKEHYHVTRPHNKKASEVSLWRSVEKLPNSEAAKSRAEDIFLSPFDPKVFELYKSTEAVTDGKVRIPKYIWRLGAIAVVCVLIAGGLLYNAVGHFKDGGNIRNQAKEIADVKDKTASGSTVQASTDNPDLSNFCRQGLNVSKPECVKWFDDLSKSNNSVLPTGEVVQTVSYNPNKPYDFDYVPQVEPTDFPRMSGVIRMKTGRLVAVDQQGNYMLDVSQNDCKRWLDGYRPFNYFASNQSQSNQQQTMQAPVVTERVSTSELHQLNPEIPSL